MPPFPILLAEAPRSVFFGREGATLFLAALNARFVVSEDALRLHVHAGSEAKTGSKVATLAEELKKLNYSCPSAVPTAVNRRATLNGPVIAAAGTAP